MNLFRKFEIALSRKCGKQIKTLKNKPYLPPTYVRALRVRYLREIFPVDQYTAARGTQQTA
jgi:hypothetical protein